VNSKCSGDKWDMNQLYHVLLCLLIQILWTFGNSFFFGRLRDRKRRECHIDASQIRLSPDTSTVNLLCNKKCDLIHTHNIVMYKVKQFFVDVNVTNSLHAYSAWLNHNCNNYVPKNWCSLIKSCEVTKLKEAKIVTWQLSLAITNRTIIEL